jgi:hypothetical protein
MKLMIIVYSQSLSDNKYYKVKLNGLIFFLYVIAFLKKF